MSDLQCPATLVLAFPCLDSPHTGDGTRDARLDLARRLRLARLAMIYTSDAHGRVADGDALAAELGVASAVKPDLGERPRDDARGSSRPSNQAELESIADLHRGETVLVIADREALAAAVASKVVVRRAAGADVASLFDRVPGWAVLQVDVDADGWVPRRGGGSVLG
jgi:hypothetical protein